MTGQEIVEKVKALKWSKGSYIVFGSGPLAAAGLREASDIDFLVSEELFSRLHEAGWKILNKDNKYDNPLVFDVFEAHKNWDFSSYSPTLENLLSSAKVIDGISFASLLEVRKWKLASGRPKDLSDIKLITEHLSE